MRKFLKHTRKTARRGHTGFSGVMVRQQSRSRLLRYHRIRSLTAFWAEGGTGAEIVAAGEAAVGAAAGEFAIPRSEEEERRRGQEEQKEPDGEGEAMELDLSGYFPLE